MSAQLNAPLFTMVVAVDVVAAADNAPSRGQDDFARLLVSTVGQRCAIQRFDRAGESSALTLVLLPDEPAATAVQRVMHTAAQFVEQNANLEPRLVFHHGVVFSAQEGDRSHFVGSAIRSAQSLLRRLPKTTQYLATKDFAEFSSSLSLKEVKLVEREDAHALDQLWQVHWLGEREIAAVQVSASSVTVNDAELKRYLCARLAEDIGPFASAIVDSAVMSAPSISALTEELSREIDNADARDRFKLDVERQIASMDKGSLLYQHSKNS